MTLTVYSFECYGKLIEEWESSAECTTKCNTEYTGANTNHFISLLPTKDFLQHRRDVVWETETS